MSHENNTPSLSDVHKDALRNEGNIIVVGTAHLRSRANELLQERSRPMPGLGNDPYLGRE